MAYSLNKLKKKSDVDELVVIVEKEKSDLEFQKSNLLHQESGFGGGVEDVDTELDATTTELGGVNDILAGVGAGKTKTVYEKKKAALTLRQLILTEKKKQYGVVAQLENQFRKAQVELQLTEAVALLASLATRKAELPD